MADIPFDKTYNNAKYKNPGDNVDYKVKRGIGLNEDTDKIRKQWYLDKCEWIYSSYLRDGCYIPYSQTLGFRENRLYAQGMQDITQYTKRLTVEDRDKPGQRKGYMNISWDIVPLLPKFIAIILGKFEDIDYTMQVRSIDDRSKSVRDDIKATIMLESKYGEMLQSIRSAIGKDADPEIKDAKLPYIPQTADELDMMVNLGAIKLAWESSMDFLLNQTQMTINWPELKRRLLEDAIICGLIAVKDYQDPQTKLPMVRYVDPENLIIRQTRHNDFFDVTEAGEIVWMTIEELRSYGLKEDELQQVGITYQNNWGNASYVSPFAGAPVNNNVNGGIRGAVLDVEFQSFDRQFYEGRMVNGKEAVFELPHGSTKATSNSKRFFTKEKPKFYRAKWVIGTKILFDYGLQFDVPYQQITKAKSSYSCYRISARSMVNQCISVVNDFQMKIYKLRNALAQSRPSGIMVDYASISNISYGGRVLAPNEVLNIYDQRGDLLYKSAINPLNGMQVQGGPPPVLPLTGGMGTYAKELIEGMTFDMDMLRDITGLNAIVDASAPAPNALVGTAKIAEAATNHVLRPILYGYKSTKQHCFANVTNRWQIVAKFYPQEITTNNAAFETIKVAADLYEPIFDVFCDALISDEEVMDLKNAMQLSLQAAKTGSIGITMRDYFYLNQMIETGNIRWAWVYLSYREAKMKKETEEAAAASQAQIGEQTMMLEDKKEKFELEKIRVAEQEKRKTLALKYEFDLKIAALAQKNSAPKEATAS